jgi:hypothetical protein
MDWPPPGAELPEPTRQAYEADDAGFPDNSALHIFGLPRTLPD